VVFSIDLYPHVSKAIPIRIQSITNGANLRQTNTDRKRHPADFSEFRVYTSGIERRKSLHHGNLRKCGIGDTDQQLRRPHFESQGVIHVPSHVATEFGMQDLGSAMRIIADDRAASHAL